jgi:ATP-dependent helicase HrpB
VESALRLLLRLGAIDSIASPRVTPLGRQLQRVPVHPRLARILLDGRGAPNVAAACALLSEPQAPPHHVQRVVQELQRVAGQVLESDPAPHASEGALRHAVYVGYADRLARRRADAPERVVLASGHGAILTPESGAGDGEYLVALEVIAAQRDGISEARIRSASPVEREWIVPTSTDLEHVLDPASGRVRAINITRYDAIVVSETPTPAVPGIRAALLRDAWLAREPDERTQRLLRRLRFAGLEVNVPALVGQAAASAERLDDIDLEAQLPFEAARALAQKAPASLVVPSGRTMPLAYGDDGGVEASVKLQELFGLAESPAIGPRRVPVTFHLLAPNGRPVQTTRDLRSFWERTYPEVRRELRGRYPKHPWPEDPWTAPPTHRTTRRRGR